VISIIVLTVVVLGSLAAWHWWPREKPSATPAMRAAMSTLASSVPAGSTRPLAASHPASDRQRLMAAAFSLEGTPYKWGAKSGDSLDCSGFTKVAYSKVGVKLPDGSFNQAAGEQPLEDVRDLTAGDLLFYRWAGTTAVTHVTMYAGDGWVIGTGTPGQPWYVGVYPISYDVVDDGRVITFRHIKLSDGS
jgi:cell wall-associated NlpC family hydrolase